VKCTNSILQISTSLDVIESKLTAYRAQKPKNVAQFFGHLTTLDSTRSYGLLSNAYYKIVLLTTDNTMDDVAEPAATGILSILTRAIVHPFSFYTDDTTGFGERFSRNVTSFIVTTNAGIAAEMQANSEDSSSMSKQK
jgi:hypothetical protein